MMPVKVDAVLGSSSSTLRMVSDLRRDIAWCSVNIADRDHDLEDEEDDDDDVEDDLERSDENALDDDGEDGDEDVVVVVDDVDDALRRRARCE